MTDTTPRTSTTQLAAAILRVADIVQGFTERYGIYRDGKAPIDQQAVLYATFDLDPANYFARENQDMALWQARWQQTRRDGTRDNYNALYDAVYETLVAELPGDWPTGDQYTPDQIRELAQRMDPALAA